MHDSGVDAGKISLPPFLELNEAVSLLKRSVGQHELYDARKENRMKKAANSLKKNGVTADSAFHSRSPSQY